MTKLFWPLPKPGSLISTRFRQHDHFLVRTNLVNVITLTLALVPGTPLIICGSKFARCTIRSFALKYFGLFLKIVALAKEQKN